MNFTLQVAEWVQVDQVADIKAIPAASEIRRLDNRREVQVSADVSGRTLGDVTSESQALIAGRDLPAGYHIRFGGESENMQETLGHTITAPTMAIIFIYMVRRPMDVT